MSRYIGPVKWLGGIAILLFVLAAVFGSVAPGMVSEDVRNRVLFQAVPFILVFVGILLLYVLLITLVALRFNGKVPGRTYNGVERLTIIGIVFGTACLFNPWSFVPYRYGFLMLLVSTLAFILWSHISPPRTDFDTNVPPLSRAQNIAGLVAGLAGAGRPDAGIHFGSRTSRTLWTSGTGVELVHAGTAGRSRGRGYTTI